jgi:hypothetical protein
MAGAKYDPEKKILAAKQAIANQKLLVKQAIAVRGTARKWPVIMMVDFVMYDFFSNLSLSNPPISALENPKIVKAAALITAY